MNPGALCCTTRIGVGKLPGNFDNRYWSAPGPPVEAATATTFAKKEGVSSLVLGPSSFFRCAGRQCRTTLTWAIALTVAMSFWEASLKADEAGPGGLRRAVSAPAWSARIAKS